MSLFREQRYLEAAAALRAALIRDPQPQYRWNLARGDEEAGDLATAHDLFQKDYCHPGRTKKVRTLWRPEAIGTTDQAKAEVKRCNAADVCTLQPGRGDDPGGVFTRAPS